MKTTSSLLTCLLLLAVGQISARPQINTPDLDADTAVDDIIGARTGAGYGPGDDIDASDIDPDTVAAVFQVVKNVPADYVGDDGKAAYTEEETQKVSEQVDLLHANCSDYTETLGYTCVPYYQCSQGVIITDGAGLIDVRFGGEGSGVYASLNPLESKCPGFLDVCCKDPDFVPPPKPKLVHKPKCGRHNEAGLGARIQGFKEDESQFGEWPHMCAVLHDKVAADGKSGNFYKCGGSLIAPGVILTGAHCVESFASDPTVVKVRCGEWDTQRESEPYVHQDRRVASMKIHPEFHNRSLANDVALLFLQEDFELNFHIDTICMPQPNAFYDFSRCYATGWGKNKFGADGEYQVVLKEIELPVVNHVTCQESLRSTRLGKYFKLHNSFLCAGGEEGKDTCKGDGGSPLVCPSQNDPTVFEQAGIVAWGIGCGENGVPGVYASVAQAACWIDYAMTCHYGGQTNDFNSYFGYDEGHCGFWLQEKIATLNGFEEAAGASYNPVYENLKSKYQECSVSWVKSEPESYPTGKDTSNANLDAGVGDSVPGATGDAVGDAVGSQPSDPAVKDSEVHITGESYNTDELETILKGDSESDSYTADVKDDTADGYTDDASAAVKEADNSGYVDPDAKADNDAGYTDGADVKDADAYTDAAAEVKDSGDGYSADVKEVEEDSNQYK